MRTTHVYMLVGDGWAYPGRHLRPSDRLLEHLAGECRTTAPRIAADKLPPVMVPMPDYDFDLDDSEAANQEWLASAKTEHGQGPPHALAYKSRCH